MVDLAGLLKVWDPRRGRHAYFGLDHYATCWLGEARDGAAHNAVHDAQKSVKVFNAYTAVMHDPDAVAAVGERILSTPPDPSFSKLNPTFEGTLAQCASESGDRFLFLSYVCMYIYNIYIFARTMGSRYFHFHNFIFYFSFLLLLFFTFSVVTFCFSHLVFFFFSSEKSQNKTKKKVSVKATKILASAELRSIFSRLNYYHAR